jgi:hypothetical protein
MTRSARRSGHEWARGITFTRDARTRPTPDRQTSGLDLRSRPSQPAGVGSERALNLVRGLRLAGVPREGAKIDASWDTGRAARQGCN